MGPSKGHGGRTKRKLRSDEEWRIADGGEGLVMRKGYRREARSEGSAKQRCEPMNKNRIRGASAGRAGDVPRSPYPSTARSVDPAVVH